jgi:hypothetical protein
MQSHTSLPDPIWRAANPTKKASWTFLPTISSHLLDIYSEDTTSSLDAERERADINQNNVGSSFRTRKDTTLNGSTISDSLIRVDSL